MHTKKEKNLAKKAKTPGLGRKQRMLHTGTTGDKGKSKNNPSKHSY